MGRVDGKVVLITGAASGLGFADAQRLAEEGASLVLTDVSRDGGEALAKEIGEAALFIEQDVTQGDKVIIPGKVLHAESEVEDRLFYIVAIPELLMNRDFLVMRTDED